MVPAFNLAVVEEPMRVDALLEDLDAHVDGNDHFEFFWVPHTGWALTKRNNRTDEPLAPRGRVTEWWNDRFLQNYAFGALCRVGRVRPAVDPTAGQGAPGRRPCHLRRPELPRVRQPAAGALLRDGVRHPAIEAGAEALNRIRRFVDDAGLLLSFPVEVRFTAPDDIPLSTASGRPSRATSPSTSTEGMDYEPYFDGVEAHHGRTSAGDRTGASSTSRPRPRWPARYPQWERFIVVRDRIDPDRRFANAYLDRVLGP